LSVYVDASLYGYGRMVMCLRRIRASAVFGLPHDAGFGGDE